MAATGVDGVMSAESLLADPALFSQVGWEGAPGGAPESRTCGLEDGGWVGAGGGRGGGRRCITRLLAGCSRPLNTPPPAPRPCCCACSAACSPAARLATWMAATCFWSTATWWSCTPPPGAWSRGTPSSCWVRLWAWVCVCVCSVGEVGLGPHVSACMLAWRRGGSRQAAAQASAAPVLLSPIPQLRCGAHPPTRPVPRPVRACAPAGPWLTEFTDLREQLNHAQDWDMEQLRGLVFEVLARIEATGRTHPVPALSARALARMQAEAGKQAAIEEQQREQEALQRLGGGDVEAQGAAAASAAGQGAVEQQAECAEAAEAPQAAVVGA